MLKGGVVFLGTYDSRRRMLQHGADVEQQSAVSAMLVAPTPCHACTHAYPSVMLMARLELRCKQEASETPWMLGMKHASSSAMASAPTLAQPSLPRGPMLEAFKSLRDHVLQYTFNASAAECMSQNN